MTAGLFTILTLGFLVGFRHAFEPDHLAAVTTLATRGRGAGVGQAARLGVAWGTGHTASIAAVAAALLFLGLRIPPSVHRMAELGVAFLLIALGLSTLWREARQHRERLGALHAAAHATGVDHSHPADRRTAPRAFVFGIAHGLAGSGAVLVFLVAAATSIGDQMGYLVAFGVGTIAGMSLVSGLTGLLAGAAAGRGARWTIRIRVGAAAASTLAGAVLGWGVVAG